MNNENNFENQLENGEEQTSAQEPAAEQTAPVRETAEPQPETHVAEKTVTEQETEPVSSEQTVEQSTDAEPPKAEEPQEQPSQNDGYNSQYTYNNVNPEPKNYYTEQKHYVPNQFNNMNGSQPQGGAYYRPNQPPVNNNNKKPDNGKKGLKIFIALAVAVAVFIVGVGFGKLASGTADGNKVTSSDKSDDSLKYSGEDIDVNSGNAIEREDIKPDENGKYTADQVAELVGASVVNIQVYSNTDSSAGATASGVILNDKGYIITNDHIYSEVANAKFVVTLNDGTSYKASYVAGDQRSDIAVLKFDDIPDNLIAATFADSSEVKAGDDVIAIGSPYGLSGTVTKGIVSYPSRRISTSTTDSEGNTTASYSMRVIQTDVALNSGNSGGALVNMYGQVVGINSSKIAITGYEGLCFAIPSNDAVKYAKSLVKNGVVANRARLGITYTAITSASAILNDLPAGLVIQEIDSKSELSTKGLTVGENGDIITEMNGQKITTSDIALDIIDDSSAGDEVELKVYSRTTKKEMTYKVKLLEDTSNTSYVNEIPKPSTTNGYSGSYDGGYGEGYDSYGNGGSDGYGGNESGGAYDYDEYFQSPFEFGQ